MDRTTSETLLDSGHAAPDTPLGRLLANARAPAGPHELVGEQAAVAMLRSAGAVGAPPGRRRALSRVLAVKIGAVGVLLAGSGLAVAGATGTLPVPTFDDRPTMPVGPPVPPAPTPTPGPPGLSVAPDRAQSSPSPAAPPLVPATATPRRQTDRTRPPGPPRDVPDPAPSRRRQVPDPPRATPPMIPVGPGASG